MGTWTFLFSVLQLKNTFLFIYFNQVGFPLYTDQFSKIAFRVFQCFPILAIVALYCGHQILINFLLVISTLQEIATYLLPFGGYGFKLMLRMIITFKSLLFRLSAVLVSFSGHWLFPAPWDAFACRTTVSLRQRSFVVQILLHASQGQMLFQRKITMLCKTYIVRVVHKCKIWRE